MSARALRIGLFASIILNVFLAAAFVGALGLTGYVVRHPAAPMRQAARDLDPAHREAFNALLRQQGHVIRQMNQQARALRLEVWKAMQAPGFDPAAAKLKLAQARTLTFAGRASVEDAVADFAATLPLDQRATLGRSFERMTPRPRPRPAGRHGPFAPG
jgi:uncharacterized membrane protein